MEEIEATWAGKSESTYMAKFYHGEYGRWERVTITKFPISFFERIFGRFFGRNVVDVPVLMNVKDIEYVDLPKYDAIRGEFTDKKKRLIFADLHLHENHAIMEKLPAISKAQGTIKNLTLENEGLRHQIYDLCLSIEALNEDISKKKSIDLLKWVKEIRSKVSSYELPHSYNQEDR